MAGRAECRKLSFRRILWVYTHDERHLKGMLTVHSRLVCCYIALTLHVVSIQPTLAQMWVPLGARGASPSLGRADASAVFDPFSHRMILFGGVRSGCGSPASNDTFILTNANGLGRRGSSASGWLGPLSFSSALPLGRRGHIVAYSPISDRMIIFGGERRGCSSEKLDDLWILEGASGWTGKSDWHRVPAATALPVPRSDAVFAFDIRRNRMLVYGGTTGTGELTDFWLLEKADAIPPAESSNWVRLTPTGPQPSSTSGSAFGYDVVSGRIMIVSPRKPDQAALEYYVVRDANGASGSPKFERFDLAGAVPGPNLWLNGKYDETSNRLILLAGDATSAQPNEVWAIDHANAVDGKPSLSRVPTDLLPFPRGGRGAGPALASDPVSKLLVLFGGRSQADLLEDVWTLRFGSACVYSITPESRTITGSEGLETIEVATLETCGWSPIVRGNNPKYTTSPRFGIGSGTAQYSWSSFPLAPGSGGSAEWYIDIEGQTHTIRSFGDAQPPEFDVSINPTARSIARGQTAVFDVRVVSIQGFSEDVRLELVNLPTGLAAGTGFSSTIVKPPVAASVHSTLTVVSDDRTPSGTFNLFVRASSPGFSAKTRQVTITVGVARNFSVEPARLTVKVLEGSKDPVSRVVQLGGESGRPFKLAINNRPWLFLNATTGTLPKILELQIVPERIRGVSDDAEVRILSEADEEIGRFVVSVEVQKLPAGSFRVLAPSLQMALTGDADNDRRSAVFGVQNTSSQKLTIQSAVKKDSNGSTDWGTVYPQSVEVSEGQSAEFSIQIRLAGLPGGVTAQRVIIITAGGQSVELPVTITESTTPLVSLSAERGITLFSQEGQWRPRSQQVMLANGGPGDLDWAVTAGAAGGNPNSTQGVNLITVEPAFRGILKPGEPQRLLVQTAKPVENLRADTPRSRREASLIFSYAHRRDEPDIKPVYVEVVKGPLPPTVDKGGVILGLPGQAAESIKVEYTVGNQEVLIDSALPKWLGASFRGAAVANDKQPAELVLSLVDTTELKIGERATLTLRFPGLLKVNGSEHRLNIEVVVGGLEKTASAGQPQALRSAAAVCDPNRLTAVFLSPTNLFEVRSRLPVPVEARIADDCGTFLQSGAASVFFSSGDPALSLTAWPDGIWRGTWQPVTSDGAQVRLKLSAFAAGGLLSTQAFVFGSVLPNADAPIIKPGSVLNAASVQANGDTVSPGQIISIFGDQLAGESQSVTAPTTSLAGIRVRLGNTLLPLFFASRMQINAVVPFGINGGPTQLVVERDGAISVPLPLVVTPAQPGIFTVSQKGSGQGAVLNQQGILADSRAPARRGEIIQIYCTGLGVVSPNVDVSQPAPGVEPLARVTGVVQVVIGTSSAEVLYAGIAPGFHGLYQVNVRVPQAVTPDPAVPLRLSVDGVDSNSVSLAVQ